MSEHSIQFNSNYLLPSTQAIQQYSIKLKIVLKEETNRRERNSVEFQPTLLSAVHCRLQEKNITIKLYFINLTSMNIQIYQKVNVVK